MRALVKAVLVATVAPALGLRGTVLAFLVEEEAEAEAFLFRFTTAGEPLVGVTLVFFFFGAFLERATEASSSSSSSSSPSLSLSMLWSRSLLSL